MQRVLCCLEFMLHFLQSVVMTTLTSAVFIQRLLEHETVMGSRVCELGCSPCLQHSDPPTGRCVALDSDDAIAESTRCKQNTVSKKKLMKMRLVMCWSQRFCDAMQQSLLTCKPGVHMLHNLETRFVKGQLPLLLQQS